MNEGEVEKMDEEFNYKYFQFKDFLRYLNIIIQRRIVFFVIFFLITFPTLIYLIVTPPIFTSVTTLLPTKPAESSALKSLALAAGNIVGSSVTRGADLSSLYEPILKSRKIIYNILNMKFYSDKTRSNQKLIDILEIDDNSLNAKLSMGYEEIKTNMLRITTDENDGIVTILVDSKNALLSSEINKELVRELDRYLRNVNIMKAKENKDFINERLNETLILLENSEETLMIFRQNNKRIEKSPELQLKAGRLMRDQKLQEELFIVLKKEYELSRIEEVKSLPMIMVLDEAIPPIVKNKPRRKAIMIFAIIIGSVFGIVISFIYEFLVYSFQDEAHLKLVKKAVSPILNDYHKVISYFSRSKTPTN